MCGQIYHVINIDIQIVTAENNSLMMPLRLKAERLRRGWTQTTLSALTGIAQSDLSAIENGHRRAGAGQRRRIALVIGLPEAHLFAVNDIAIEPSAGFKRDGR